MSWLTRDLKLPNSSLGRLLYRATLWVLTRHLELSLLTLLLVYLHKFT